MKVSILFGRSTDLRAIGICWSLVHVCVFSQGQSSPCIDRDCTLEIHREEVYGLDTTNLRLWFNNNQNVIYEATRINLRTGQLMESNKIIFSRRNDSLAVSTLSNEFLRLEVMRSEDSRARLGYFWKWEDDQFIYYLTWRDINDCCSVVQFNRRPIKHWGKRFARWKWLGDYVIARPEGA